MNRSIDIRKYAVPVERLRWICPGDIFQFECTSDIEPLKEFIGQVRAIDAINFGLAVERAGYNLFLTGLTGTGKAATIKASLRRFIEDRKTQGITYEIHDWCYVYNFAAPDQPRILKLPQGMGKSFANQMEALLKVLKEEIPKTFGSEEYTKKKQEVMEEHQRKYQGAIDELERDAAGKNLMVQLSPTGAAVVPIEDGTPLTREEFLKRPESERTEIESKRLEVMKKVDETYNFLRELEKDIGEKMKEIDLKAGQFAIERPFADLLKTYAEYQEVINFLNEMREHTLTKLDVFMQAPQSSQIPASPVLQTDPFTAYKVNVFVDNSSLNAPPVIFEPNPNWFNVFGKIE